VNGGSSTNVVRLQSFVICQLLSRMDQSNLIDLDTFLFLQGLLDRQYLVFWFKIEGLLAPCQSFDKDL
jgi:hypothetical protein